MLVSVSNLYSPNNANVWGIYVFWRQKELKQTHTQYACGYPSTLLMLPFSRWACSEGRKKCISMYLPDIDIDKLAIGERNLLNGITVLRYWCGCCQIVSASAPCDSIQWWMRKVGARNRYLMDTHKLAFVEWMKTKKENRIKKSPLSFGYFLLRLSLICVCRTHSAIIQLPSCLLPSCLENVFEFEDKKKINSICSGR